MLPQADPNIRGWLVEAAVQMALLSTFREGLLAMDRYNSYHLHARGSSAKCGLGTPGGSAVFLSVDRGLWRYHQRAVANIDTATGSYSAELADGTTFTGVAAPAGRTYSPIQFTRSSQVAVTLPAGTPAGIASVVVQARVLPDGPAATYLEEGIRSLAERGGLLDTDGSLVERVGAAVMHIMREGD